MILREYGIRRVYYSTDEGTIVSEKLEEMDLLYACRSKRTQRFELKKLKDCSMEDTQNRYNKRNIRGWNKNSGRKSNDSKSTSESKSSSETDTDSE